MTKEELIKNTMFEIMQMRDYKGLRILLSELFDYRTMTCDYCGLEIRKHEDARIAARSCGEDE